MDNFGILTLIPPVFIIVFALVTKRTFEALLLGAMIGFFMTDTWNVVGATIGGFSTTIGENVWMVLVFGVLGSFAFLLQASKGTLGFGKLVRKFANTQKKSLFVGWILGIIVFMDDYLNILTVSSALRETTDKQKTPREMLAYVIDSTGAPVCVLIPLSSWAVFFGASISIQEGMEVYGSATEIYIQSLPFILYGWVAVLVVPLVIFRVIPPLFGMKKAYERVETTGRVYSVESDELNQGITDFDKLMENNETNSGNILNFLIPMAVVIGVTVVTMDVLAGLVWAVIAMAIIYIPTKVIKFGEFCESFAKGFASMIPMMFITIGALTVKLSMDGIGLPQYVIDAVLPYMIPALFPAIAFVVVAGLSFITGSNWGIPVLTIPILIPLAFAAGVNPLIVFGAIVSGGTFGSHACFYSDATVLTSQVTGIKNMEHATTQFPYALISAIIAFIGFVICGFAFS